MGDRATVTFRVDHANPAHVTLSVFVGRTEGARARAGTLTLRTDEVRDLLATTGGQPVLDLGGALRVPDADVLSDWIDAIGRR